MNRQPSRPTKTLVLAVAQMRFRADVAGNTDWICRTIAAAGNADVGAILFPECAVTGYNVDFKSVARREVEAALDSIGQSARRARCNVLVGSPTWRGRMLQNSLVVFNRSGRQIFCYSKIHLTARDTRWFAPGNALALFKIEGIPCTAIICHERRYPELVRLPVMMGAQIMFHPNAGLDRREVSKAKRRGRDGIAVRAFENEIYYAFANSVGAQGDALWSAGDSKIVAPDSSVLALANNRDEMVVQAELDLSRAGRKYAREALEQPVFLRSAWRGLLARCQRQLRRHSRAETGAPKIQPCLHLRGGADAA